MTTGHVPHLHDHRDVSLVTKVTHLYALGLLDFALFCFDLGIFASLIRNSIAVTRFTSGGQLSNGTSTRKALGERLLLISNIPVTDLCLKNSLLKFCHHLLFPLWHQHIERCTFQVKFRLNLW